MLVENINKIIEENQDDNLKTKMELVLNDLKSTKHFKFTSENTGIHHSDIYGWISKGKDTHEEPYYSFYIESYMILGLIDHYGKNKFSDMDDSLKESENPKKYDINHELKSFSINDFDEDIIYEFDYKLSESENIIRKFILIKHGRDLENDKKYDESINYYKSLLNNSYFQNDYYIYRRIIICYSRKKQWDKRLETIKEFLKSDICGSEYQIMWMAHKLFRSEEHGDITPDEVDYLINYYENNGAMHEDLQNYPVVLAERIYQSKKDLKIHVESFYNYNKKQYRLELIEMVKELKFNEEYDEALDFCWFHVKSNVLGSSDLFREIVEIYEKLGDWDSELISLSIFVRKKYNILGNFMKRFIRKKLNNVNEELNTNFTIDDLKDDDFTVINDSPYHNLSNESILKIYEKLYENGFFSESQFKMKEKLLID